MKPGTVFPFLFIYFLFYRYVWKVFLESGDYARALTVAKERIHLDPEALELVLKRQADKFIAEKK